jgi:nitrile hydratase accessory protein
MTAPHALPDGPHADPDANADANADANPDANPDASLHIAAPIPPPFEQPWHAQAFSLTVALSEAGHFTWPVWAAAFGATLARHRGAQGDLDGGDQYFAAWLETLEGLLDTLGLADADQAGAMRDRWEAAYLATPHGRPVNLAD